MATQKLVLTLDKEIYGKTKAKAKKLCFPNTQQFIYELIRRAIQKKHAGGRPREKSTEEEFEDKFSKPTKKSRKIDRWIRRSRIGF